MSQHDFTDPWALGINSTNVLLLPAGITLAVEARFHASVEQGKYPGDLTGTLRNNFCMAFRSVIAARVVAILEFRKSYVTRRAL